MCAPAEREAAYKCGRRSHFDCIDSSWLVGQVYQVFAKVDFTNRVAIRTLFETGARSMASSCDKGCKQTEASEILLPI